MCKLLGSRVSQLINSLLNDRHRKWRDIKRDYFVQFHSRKIIETGAKFIRSETGKHKTVLHSIRLYFSTAQMSPVESVDLPTALYLYRRSWGLQCTKN